MLLQLLRVNFMWDAWTGLPLVVSRACYTGESYLGGLQGCTSEVVIGGFFHQEYLYVIYNYVTLPKTNSSHLKNGA